MLYMGSPEVDGTVGVRQQRVYGFEAFVEGPWLKVGVLRSRHSAQGDRHSRWVPGDELPMTAAVAEQGIERGSGRNEDCPGRFHPLVGPSRAFPAL